MQINWFSLPAIWLIHSYFTKRTKVYLEMRSLEEILFGVPQGSILGPLLSNSFFCDLSSTMNDIDFVDYKDNNTSFLCRWHRWYYTEIGKYSENTSNNSTTTQMKANADKWKQKLWQKNKTLAIAFMKNFLECFFDSNLISQSHIAFLKKQHWN